MMNLKLWLIAILGIALICLDQGLAQVSNAQEKAKKKEDNRKGGVIIRKEKGPAGHSTIGIDESSVVDVGKECGKNLVIFGFLRRWDASEEILKNTSTFEGAYYVCVN